MLVVLSRGWGVQLGHPLLRVLKSKYPDSQYVGLVHGEGTFDFLKKQSDIEYKELHLLDALWNDALDPKNVPSISIDKIEKELGIKSIWEIIGTVRSLVYDMRTYPLFRYRKTVSDEVMINLVKIFFVHIKNVFHEYNPDVIFTHSFVTMYHILLYHYAKKHGVYMFGIGDTKVKGYHFEHDIPEYLLPKRVEKCYQKNLNDITSSNNYQKAIDYINKNRQQLDIPDYASEKNKHLDKEYKQAIKKIFLLPLYFSKYLYRWIVKVDARNKFKHLDNIGPFIKSKTIIWEYQAIAFFRKITFHQISKSDKFIYFPLQYEPEAHTLVQAPYFTNQLELVRMVAKSLPGEYSLYVKEHPAMLGKRKPGYYKKIMSLPNVTFIDYKYTSADVLPKCTAVVTATGTSSFEAAILKKPSIVFGNDLIIDLPQIYHITDFTALSALFQEISSIDYTEKTYDNALMAYITAVMDCGIELDYTKLHAGDKEEFLKWAEYIEYIITYNLSQ